jgi:hypothetical protein
MIILLRELEEKIERGVRLVEEKKVINKMGLHDWRA